MEKSKFNVLLISKKTEYAFLLHEALSRKAGYTVHFEETAPEAMALITSGILQSIVFNFENFGESQVKIVRGIFEISTIKQILIFTESAPTEVRELIKDFHSLVVLEKTYVNVDRDIVGLCERLMEEKQVVARESVRHPLNQKVLVEYWGSGKTYKGLVRDIGTRGACIEINTNTIKVNDLIKMTINLDELGKTRVVNAEVRWVKVFPGRGRAGVQFIKS